MCGVAAQPEIVQLLAGFFRVIGCPLEVRRVKFDTLVAHFGYSLECGLRILLQFIAN